MIEIALFFIGFIVGKYWNQITDYCRYLQYCYRQWVKIPWDGQFGSYPNQIHFDNYHYFEYADLKIEEIRGRMI